MGRNDTILKVKNLTKEFYKNKKLFTAVDHISFQLQKGECLGIVGESGCGKTTTIKMITQLLKADSGEIWVDGKQIAGQKQQNRKEIKNLYTKIQMVFQTPQDSFDPRRTLGDGIMESVYNHRMSKKEARMRMEQLLQQVELPLELAERYPHQVSGGQCQRAAIARALAIAPDILICDEATSALDVTVQLQVLREMKKLRDMYGTSIVLVTHNIGVVNYLADHVAVMHQGKLVEYGTKEDVLNHPQDAYTKKLIGSVLHLKRS